MSTSWGHVADWYEQYLGGDDTYQQKVIQPNLLRAMSVTAGEPVLDLACGTGYFTLELKNIGADVVGADVGVELIAKAKEQNPTVRFEVTASDNLSFATNGSFSKVSCVLAIQNIEKIKETFLEVQRILKPGGSFFIVLNHPAFRIPHGSSWGYDSESNTQYRRVDQYLSQKRVSIEMNPGQKNSPTTISFHRSLQDYSKLLANSGFTLARIEEWISHKQSQPGPRKIAEDRARKEIPLFMLLEAKKSV